MKTIELASLMDVPVVNCFSGTAGDHEGAKYPNWPVTPWPNEYGDVLKWQWEEKLIPYWKEVGQYAQDHNVKIGLELHGGFLVHTPYTLVKACAKKPVMRLVQIWILVIYGGRESIRLRRLKF